MCIRDRLGAGSWRRDEGALPRAARFLEAQSVYSEALLARPEADHDNGPPPNMFPDEFWATRDQLQREIRDRLRADLGEEICARIRYGVSGSGRYAWARDLRWPDVAAALE